MIRTRTFLSRNLNVYPERPQESVEISYNAAETIIELGTAPILTEEGSSI
jgi:hypothetical protein